MANQTLLDYFTANDMYCHISSVLGLVLEESPCPRESIYKSLSLDHKVLENFQGLNAFCKLSVMYDHDCDVHKFCYCHRA